MSLVSGKMEILTESRQRSGKTISLVNSTAVQILPKHSSDVENSSTVQCCSDTEPLTTSGYRSHYRKRNITEADICRTRTKVYIMCRDLSWAGLQQN